MHVCWVVVWCGVPESGVQLAYPSWADSMLAEVCWTVDV